MNRHHMPVIVLSLFLASAGASGDDAKGDKVQAQSKPSLAKEVLGSGNVDLTKAMEAAQKIVPDGKPLAARLEKKEGKARFGFYFLKGDTIREVEIDAASGNMVDSQEAKDTKRVNGETLDDARKAVQNATVGFSQAITIGTEQVKGGKPFEAEIRMQDGKAVIEVELLAGDKLVKVQVDASNSRSVKVIDVKE